MSINNYTLQLKNRILAFEDDFTPWKRGLEATKIYRDHSDMPVVIKRAEIISRTLEALQPIILEEEWVYGPLFRNYPVHKGVSSEHLWKINAAFPEHSGYKESWPIPDDIKFELSFWKNTSIQIPNQSRKKYGWINKYGIANSRGFLGAHTLPDHGILLKCGIRNLLTVISQRIESEKDQEKLNEFTAMKICLKALSEFCVKYSRALKEKALQIEDNILKARLLNGANNLQYISQNAPKTLLQAMQLLFFSHLMDQLDSNGDAPSFGRVDQLLNMYYENDIQNRIIDNDTAFDYVCHFILKNWKPQSSCNMTVGGMKRDGSDAVNELSYMFLNAMNQLETPVDMTVRFHENTSDDFVRTTLNLIRKSLGRPNIYNDEIMIPALVKRGVDLEDAREYAPLGCVEIMIPGLTNFRTMGLRLYLLKILELVLNKGCCMITGDKVFDDIPEDFDSYEALINIYHEKVRHVINLSLIVSEEDEIIEPQFRPRPWLTLLCHGGVEKGIDITAGLPKYNSCGKTLASIADVSNSLFVIRKLVFEDMKLTLPELRNILLNDWYDNEPLRQYIINKLPRYGQDNEDINKIVQQETNFYAECLDQRKPAYGSCYWPMLFTLEYKNEKINIGASPCGRKSRDPLSGSLQPNMSGPQGTITQILNSAASIDFTQFAGGVSNVQEFDPSLFMGEEGLERLNSIVQGFFEKGGLELGINFISEEVLEDAMKNPQNHMNLMVRLFGLSARFVSLSKDVQENVIERVRAASKRAV